MAIFDDLPQLYFHEWKYLDASLIWIYEGTPQTEGKVWASNTHFTAWFFLRGRVEVEVAGEKAHAHQGQWLFLPPGVSRREFSPGARILSLHFDANWITGQALFKFKHALILESDLTPSWESLCRPMLKVVRRYFPDAYNQLPVTSAHFGQYAAIQGDFQRWLGCIWKPLQEQGACLYLPQHNDSRALDMKRWMDALSVQNAFRLQDLAEAFVLSPTQVNRLFCAEFGITPKRYFEQKRLAYAQAALVASIKPMKEISYSTGFRHQSEFTAWFKKHTGLPPSEFRSQSAAVN
jgi:AraC-like DNA-binding protein